MSKPSYNSMLAIISLIVAVVGFFAFRNFLQDESGKIVSDAGEEILNNKDLMKRVDEKLSPATGEAHEGYGEVYIDLDK